MARSSGRRDSGAREERTRGIRTLIISFRACSSCAMSGLSAVVGARGGTLQSDCAVRVHSCRAGEHPASGRRVVFREQTRRDGGRYKRGLTDRQNRQNRCLASLISLSAVTCLRPLRLASRRRATRPADIHDSKRDAAMGGIYNKARGAEDGTPTCHLCLFHKGQAHAPHTCTHMSHPQTPVSGMVSGSGHRPKRRKPAHSAAAHQPRRAPTHSPPHPGELLALPLIGYVGLLVRGGRSTGAHLHAI